MCFVVSYSLIVVLRLFVVVGFETLLVVAWLFNVLCDLCFVWLDVFLSVAYYLRVCGLLFVGSCSWLVVGCVLLVFVMCWMVTCVGVWYMAFVV